MSEKVPDNSFDDIFGKADPQAVPQVYLDGGQALRMTSKPFPTLELAGVELFSVSRLPSYVFGYVDLETRRVVSFHADENPELQVLSDMRRVTYVLRPQKTAEQLEAAARGEHEDDDDSEHEA